VSSFAGPIPSMDKKMRHSSASVAYAATTRLAWRAVLSASGSTSPISPGSDFVGMTQLYATQIFARRHLGLLPSAEVDYPPPPPAIGQLVLAVLLRCEHLFRGAPPDCAAPLTQWYGYVDVSTPAQCTRPTGSRTAGPNPHPVQTPGPIQPAKSPRVHSSIDQLNSK